MALPAVAVLLWWLALVGHGWLLARRDAAQIDNTLDDARAGGGCDQARQAADQVWLGHRLADAPMTARADATDKDVGRYLGYVFGQLGLALRPGNEPLVDRALTGFLDRIPADRPWWPRR